jgi:hypothetical protein
LKQLFPDGSRQSLARYMQSTFATEVRREQQRMAEYATLQRA